MIMDALKTNLEKLCRACIVSGYEKSTNNTFLQILEENKIAYDIDAIGNVIFKKDGNGEKTLMLIAHYDEVGLSIKFVDDSGYIYLSPVGGVDISLLKGQRVVANKEGRTIYGVIGAQPIHMANQNKNNGGNKSIDICDLWVDFGVKSDDSSIKDILCVGDPISYAPNFTYLNEDFVVSKSLDNRCGVAALLSFYKEIQEMEINSYRCVYFVASSQEELGLRGAMVAGYNINPDVCIAIDAAHATDYPSINNRKYGDIRLGEGAVLPLGSNFDLSLQTMLKEVAISNGIKFQLDSLPCNSGTDVATIQLVRGGRQSGLISIPCRYMHTPTEVVSIRDIESVVNILSHFVKL